MGYFYSKLLGTLYTCLIELDRGYSYFTKGRSGLLLIVNLVLANNLIIAQDNLMSSVNAPSRTRTLIIGLEDRCDIPYTNGALLISIILL